MRQKEIVIVPYPFSDSDESKVRPALIVSNDKYNQSSLDFIMAPLTSVLKNDAYSIFISQDNLASGELMLASRIKANKLFSIKKSRIITKLGVLSDDKFAEVKKIIETLF